MINGPWLTIINHINQFNGPSLTIINHWQPLYQQLFNHQPLLTIGNIYTILPHFRGFEVPDLRDDLQRVAAPAEVCVWEAETFFGAKSPGW